MRGRAAANSTACYTGAASRTSAEWSAYFKLYKDAACTQEWPAGQPIGGHAYVGLYVDVDAHDGLNNPYQWDRLVIRDEYADYDPAQFGPNGPELNYADALTDSFVDGRARTSQAILMHRYFDVGSRWEELVDGAWEASDGPGVAQRGPERRLFRHVLDWDTMHKPLGNNGPHTLALAEPLQFGSAADHPYLSGMNPVRAVLPADVPADTLNMCVPTGSVTCTTGTVDYFRWDPAPGSAYKDPRLAFNIIDSRPGEYEWVVTLRRTSVLADRGWTDGRHWTVSGQVSSSSPAGTRVSVHLADGRLAGHLDPATHERGHYTYDIDVWRIGPATSGSPRQRIDHFGLKQPYDLWIPRSAPPGCSFAPAGHWSWTYVPLAGPAEVRVAYCLKSAHGAAARNAEVTVFDPSLARRTWPALRVAGTTEVLHGWQSGSPLPSPQGIPVWRFRDDDSAGVWPTLWTAQAGDGHNSVLRRTHDDQHMLAVNAEPIRPLAWFQGTRFGKASNGAPAAYDLRARQAYSWAHGSPRGRGHRVELNTTDGAFRALGALQKASTACLIGHACADVHTEIGVSFYGTDGENRQNHDSWLFPRQPQADAQTRRSSTQLGIDLPDNSTKWVNLLGMEVAVIESCGSGNVNANKTLPSIAPTAAWRCGAASAIGYKGDGLGCRTQDPAAYYTLKLYYKGLWEAWGRGADAYDMACNALWLVTVKGAPAGRPETYGIENQRVFNHGNNDSLEAEARPYAP